MAHAMEYIKTDRNGTKYFYDWNCPRCGGEGESTMWLRTGCTCYECGGNGKRRTPKLVKEYTDEYAAKLDSRRQAKWNREHADESAKAEAERAEREAAEAQRKAEEEAERIRRAGNYIGEAGQKIKTKVIFDHEASFETMYGFMTIYTMKDANGNTLVWKTGSGSLMNKAGEIPESGDEIEIQGTIKEHSEYNGVKQTVLIRVKRLG